MITASLALLVLGAPQQRLQPPSGKIAILEPIVVSAVVNSEGPRTDPYRSGKDVLTRFQRESRGWPGWKRVEVVPHDQTVKAMRDVIGPRGTPISSIQNLGMVAAKLQARYVAYYVLAELTGARTRGLGSRVTGRTTVDLRVYDDSLRSLVWSSKVVETSTVKGASKAIEPRIDQSHLNAVRQALEPFVKDGLMRAVRDEDSLIGVYR